ncbi:MAG: SgcJ/EcaC family oxidoreductase [Candidatus Solibacter sp.]
MTAVRTHSEVPSCDAVLRGVSRAWNDGDGIEFARYFTEDADLVNMHGMHVRGRQAIAGLYQMLFRSVFADTCLEYEVSGRRELCANSTLVHVRVEISVPRGQMVGDHHAQSSIVLQQNGDGWAIASLQNTMVSGMGA